VPVTGLPSVDDTLTAVVESMAAGEPRPGQLAMAAAVAKAIESRTHLLVQAGTGTGKSLAYLVPAIASGERVVISTATKALQEQLVGKDLPDLAASLRDRFGTSFVFALLKGRSNYYCRVRGASAGDDAEMLMYDADASDEVAAINRWAAESDTGDRSDLDDPVSDKAWRAVSMPVGECPGRAKCARSHECFAELARDRAAEADVVVVNHHLVALDLISMGNVLPEHSVTVVDEAHEFADIVTDVVGAQCTPSSLDRLVTRLLPQLPEADAGPLQDAIEDFGEALRSAPQGRMRSLPAQLAQTAILARSALTRALDGMKSQGKLGADDDDEAKALALRGAVLSAIETLDRAQTGTADDVVWVERGGPSSRDIRLRVAPLDVGALLAEQLFSARTVIATSATLAVGGAFDIPARRLGLEPPAQVDADARPDPHSWTGLDVGSPFDFARQGMLYVPRGMPVPSGASTAEHSAAVIEELASLIEAAGGRTLALFTTTRAAVDAAAALRPRVSHHLFVQGDAPARHLVRDFAADETSCLFATTSFWQGVDVPGAACSLVVIDKLPFPRPDDPLAVARREAADAHDGDGFTDVYVGRAAVLLAQGVGRLIRSSTDRGVVAVLDPRLLTKGYGRLMLRSLPPFGVWHDRDVVVAALRRLTAPTAPIDAAS
jgi:ATP-dependent DNA helicase DinG